MRVPDESPSGVAKVTLSFPDWKEGKVAPATFEIPVVDPVKKGEGKKPPVRKAAGEK